MDSASSLGPILHAFFTDHLVDQKGLRRSSILSYRDTLRLMISFVAAEKRVRLTRIALADLTLERMLLFLKHLEKERGNGISTRNQRLAGLHTFFEYVAGRVPEMMTICQQVAAIPTKRAAPPETRYLERDEVTTLFSTLPTSGPRALRDRALLLLLYNTGARVQEVADLRIEDIDLDRSPRVRLHGKGDKWRTCPLWEQTANLLSQLARSVERDAPVFRSRQGRPLTRFGIYKLVRRYTARLDTRCCRAE